MFCGVCSVLSEIVLIPAYKPNERMIQLISEIKELGYAIVVVDDGSGEEFSEIFEKASDSACVLSFDENKGKGEALKYGMKYIDSSFSKPYVIVTADADGQHRCEDIKKVCEKAKENPESLVLGKRKLDESAPVLSRLGNFATRVFFHMSSGRYIYETQTGLRGFSDCFVHDFLKLKGKRYEFESDMMLICSQKDIIEVDIQTVYFDNNSGTHFDPVFDTMSLHREYFKYNLPGILGAVLNYLFFSAGLLLFPSMLLPVQLCSCFLASFLRFVYQRTVFFSEKPGFFRFAVTSLVDLLLDTLIVLLLAKAGLSPYIGKLISVAVIMAVNIIIRKIFVVLFGKSYK